MSQVNENSTEALRKMMGQVANIMTLPDADVEFLSQLQLVIRNKIIGSYMEAANLGGQGQPGAAPTGPGAGPVAPNGAVPGLGLGPVPPSPMGPGGAAGGGAGGIAPPNADELRRVLSAGGM